MLVLGQVGLVPDLGEPLEHDSQLLDHVLEQVADEAEGDGHLPAQDLFEGAGGFGLGQLVAGEGDGGVAVGGGVGVQVGEGQGGEDADVAGADELQRDGAHVAPHGGEAFADEVRGQVVVEGDGPQDRVGHAVRVSRRVLGRVDQVHLDLVLGDEVRDGGGIVERVGSAPVDRAVHQVLDAGREGRVHEGDALSLLDVVRHTLLERGRDLHAENAPDAALAAGFAEDGSAVVEVSGEQGDVLGFRGQLLGAGRVGVAGQREDLVPVRGWVGDEGVDHCPALFARCADDKDPADGHRYRGSLVLAQA